MNLPEIEVRMPVGGDICIQRRAGSKFFGVIYECIEERWPDCHNRISIRRTLNPIGCVFEGDYIKRTFTYDDLASEPANVEVPPDMFIIKTATEELHTLSHASCIMHEHRRLQEVFNKEHRKDMGRRYNGIIQARKQMDLF